MKVREIFKEISRLSTPKHADMTENQQITDGYKVWEHICKDQNKLFTAAQVLDMIEAENKRNRIDNNYYGSFTYYDHE